MPDSLADQFAALTVGPDERLVIAYPHPLDLRDHDQLKEALEAVGLLGRVLVVGGPVELAVVKAEEDAA